MARVSESSTKPLLPGLYLVATPIGNLGDLSYRAVEILRSVTVIACEDTRVTAKLCQAYGITTRRIRFDAHQPPEVRERLIADILAGQSLALVSDAGSPLVSDPGQELVTEAIAQGIKIEVIPGPSAVLAALLGSGLPVQPFAFCGFPDRHRSSRAKQFATMKEFPGSLVFFESPHRLAASLRELAEVMGNRPAVIARELTKIYEEYRRGRILDLAEAIETAGSIKGESVIIVAPPETVAKPYEAAEIDRMILQGLEQMSLRDTVQTLAEATGLPRRGLFTRALELQSNSTVQEES